MCEEIRLPAGQYLYIQKMESLVGKIIHTIA